jgi:hypothetical protein
MTAIERDFTDYVCDYYSLDYYYHHDSLNPDADNHQDNANQQKDHHLSNSHNPDHNESPNENS